MLTHTIISVETTPRYAQLQAFIINHAALYELNVDTLMPASADASFRRYFRVIGKNNTSYIIMDAPPEHENCQPFVHIAHLFGTAGLHVPTVLAQDLVQGFLLLTDLGNTTYLAALQQGADHRPLYTDAITALVKLQAASQSPTVIQANVLPPYDTLKLKQEMDLFETWFLNKHHAIVLNDRERALLQVALHLISQACTTQANVWVHRDYHCRNLMVVSPNMDMVDIPKLSSNLSNPGILDFQDALTGAYTYDLVSLLRDAYIDWPEEAQIELALDYWKKAQAAGVAVPEDFGQLWRDFEWMGLQRHLKVLGVFARLYHRDGKDGYLKDLPLVLQYAQRVAQRYDGLGILVRLFDRVQGVERQVGVTF